MKLLRLVLINTVFVAGVAPVLAQSASPRQQMDELLAADRAFARSATSKTNVIDAVTPMFRDDVVMPMPGGAFAHGPDQVVKALAANNDNTTATATWTPVGGGLAADGTQGFTYGYMTVTRPDGTVVPLKYMSYWVKTPAGWRVAAYKRARRPDGETSTPIAPLLPDTMVAPVSSASVRTANAASLAAAEQSFSDDAQSEGLGPAFVKFGAPDAVNMGPEAAFLVGNEKIGAFVGAGSPGKVSPLRWSSDEKVIVASSGDLGVSIGHIYQNAPAGNASAPIAFFTIWRKVNGVWKYVAE